MSKILRIVWKDARHLRLEIAISLLLVVCFAATDKYLWGAPLVHLPHSEEIAGWTDVLMVLSWYLLVARCVHDEPLVGDRQFWVTRPYNWTRLLAAKVIFCGLFIFLPFLLADCYLLVQAGVFEVRVLPSLIERCLLTLFLCVLPVFALAAVTDGLNRMLVSIFALAAALGVGSYISFGLLSLSSHGAPRTADGEFFWMFALVDIAFCTFAIVLQYSRRATRFPCRS